MSERTEGTTGSPETPNGAMAERIRAAAELLEAIAEDRALLVEAGEEDRLRLLKAAGEVSRPDAVARRRMVQATLFAPVDFEQHDVTGEAHFREALEPQNCYVCKQGLRGAAPLLRPALPGVRGAELPEAHRDRRPDAAGSRC
jgi:hypothetical protein